MVATGRDIAVFVFGVTLAGLTPIFLAPGLDLGSMLAIATQSTTGVPLEGAAVIAVIALLGAAWVDTDSAGQATVDVEWE